MEKKERGSVGRIMKGSGGNDRRKTRRNRNKFED
jgi:hypothetical protein